MCSSKQPWMPIEEDKGFPKRDELHTLRGIGYRATENPKYTINTCSERRAKDAGSSRLESWRYGLCTHPQTVIVRVQVTTKLGHTFHLLHRRRREKVGNVHEVYVAPCSHMCCFSRDD